MTARFASGLTFRLSLLPALLPTLRLAMLPALLPALAPAALAQRSPQDSIHLTLDEALARADSVSTAVRLSRDTLAVSGTTVLESYGHFLPYMATGVGAAREQGTTLLSSTALVPTDTRFSTATVVVSTTLNLFNGLRDYRGLEASLAFRDAASFSLARARQQVAFDVTQAFEQAVLDERLVEVASATLALSRARQDQLEEQVRVGTRAPPDLYRQRAQTSADESALIDTRVREAADRIALLRRLRLEPTAPYTLVPPPEPPSILGDSTVSADSLVQVALRERPDLSAAAARSSIANFGIQQARGGYLPRVSFGLDVFSSGRVFDWERQNGTNLLTTAQRPLVDQLGKQSVGLFSLAVTWNVFDRFATRLDVERAELTSYRETLAEEDLRLRVIGDVRQASNDYGAAVQQLRSARVGLDAANQAYDAVSGRFDAGLATFVDVLTTQAALTRARALQEQAIANSRLQRAILRYVTGTSTR
jgi:outer membrane protein